MMYYSLLPDRAVFAISGEEARDFLQGLVTKDMRKVTPDNTVFAVLLSPQGRFLFDFFISERKGAFWLETDKARLPELMKRLTMYRLRAKVEFKELPLKVIAAWGTPEPAALKNAYADPRLPELGWRLSVHEDSGAPPPAGRRMGGGLHNPVPHPPPPRPSPCGGGSESSYDAHRISLGVPEGVRDLTIDRSILLEYGYDELNAIDFDKGCYVGQEVTARSKHRATLRKFIHHLEAENPLPQKGTPVMAGDREAGTITGTDKNQGLAHLNVAEVRRAAREGLVLTASGVPVKATLPTWCKTAFEVAEA